jgi:hypothetical protein
MAIKKVPAQQDQIERFKEAARSLDCSESEKQFDIQLENIGRASVPPAKAKSPAKKRKPLKIALPDA